MLENNSSTREPLCQITTDHSTLVGLLPQLQKFQTNWSSGHEQNLLRGHRVVWFMSQDVNIILFWFICWNVLDNFLRRRPADPLTKMCLRSAKMRYNRKKMENHSLKLSTSTRHGGDQFAKRISNIVKTSASVVSVFPSHLDVNGNWPNCWLPMECFNQLGKSRGNRWTLYVVFFPLSAIKMSRYSTQGKAL